MIKVSKIDNRIIFVAKMLGAKRNNKRRTKCTLLLHSVLYKFSSFKHQKNFYVDEALYMDRA